MGYFSNGTEGVGFRELWCDRCAHDRPPDDAKQCAIWLMHLAYNSEQYAAGMVPESVPPLHGPTLKLSLSWLIHDKADDMGAQECAMFLPRGDAKLTGGEVWCQNFRHLQSIEDRNADAPCLLCMVESGVLHGVETFDAYA